MHVMQTFKTLIYIALLLLFGMILYLSARSNRKITSFDELQQAIEKPIVEPSPTVVMDKKDGTFAVDMFGNIQHEIPPVD